MAEAVVDGLEAVEVAEEDGDGLIRPFGAAHRVVDTVEQKGAIGKPGERVVERFVSGLAARALVVQCKARMVCEGQDDVALARVELALGVGAANDEAPRGLVALADRRSQARRDPPCKRLGGDRAHSDLVLDGAAGVLREELRIDADGCDHTCLAGFAGVCDEDRGHLDAEELAGTLAQGLEDLVQGLAGDDRALYVGEALHQLPALAKRDEQARVGVRLDLGTRP